MELNKNMDIVYESKTEEWARQVGICNTNNHESEITFEEYAKVISETNKDKWVSVFPDPIGSITVQLTISMCEILAKAAEIGIVKNSRPKIFDEELDEIEKYIASYMDNSTGIKWFVRLNEASPKDGKYGNGPLMSAKEIVTSLVTSLRAYRGLMRSVDFNISEKLYIIPWRYDWNESCEFRVFVHERKVTALSQYVWMKDCGWNIDNMKIVAPKIVDYCTNLVIPKIIHIDSFVIDVIIVAKTSIITSDTEFQVELVELNSFGSNLASGSALFHWINDNDILYGRDNKIVARYIS